MTSMVNSLTLIPNTLDHTTLLPLSQPSSYPALAAMIACATNEMSCGKPLTSGILRTGIIKGVLNVLSPKCTLSLSLLVKLGEAKE